MHLKVTLTRAGICTVNLRVWLPRKRQPGVGEGPHVPSEELEVLRHGADP